MVMHVELQATCSALGYHEGGQYIKEPDCLETVKELIRFLRREDDTCDIRRQLGHAQILQKDLLPLVKQHHSDKPLFDTVIRLLVNLTQPVIVCFNNQLPEEKTLRQHCLEIEAHLQQYKEAFVDEKLFTVLTKKMTDLLGLDWEHRHEEDKLMLERLLVLTRNVLHIPPDASAEQRTDDDASVHDQILWAIHVSGMEDLLLYIASSDSERQLCMHILEIISLMFREQSPEILALAGVQRSMTEKEKDERELEIARTKEKEQKRTTLLRFSARHSNFGGTFVMMNTKSLSDKELIYHKPVQDADNFTLDDKKKRRKRPKNRQPIKDQPVVRRSTLSIRLGLKEFCVQFLENAYNSLMHAVKDNLQREATQDLDETYYLWSMQFFMEFCRHHSRHVDFISETMSVATFHYIYNNLLRYYEMIMVEKKEAIVWGRRVHLALRAYQELLMTLDMMDKSNNNHLMDSARIIKSNVFYMMEFRDIFITLLKRFNESRNSRTYLKDLVETTHLFLRMLEKFTKGNNHLVVQGKRHKRKKNTKKAAARRNNQEPTEQELEDVWQEISSDLSALLQGREEIPQDVTPFDATSDVDIDQQRVDAMVRIQTSLRQKRSGEAVALFRAAREVWPDQNQFGSQEITVEEEFMALREVYMAALPRGSEAGEMDTQENGLQEEEEDNEEEEQVLARADWEQEFNFTEYLMSYAKPEIVKAYVLFAGDFEKNSVHSNHCVVKMLHRIAFDLGFIGMLFQAALFRVFQKIMHGPHAKLARFQELYKFGVHVIRKFSEAAQKNKNVFMEMLFWKTNREAMQITEGYDFNPNNVKVAWTEDEENELLRLFEDFRDVENQEKDAIDLIMERWTGSNKTRGQILRHLRNLRLIESAKDLRKKSGGLPMWAWTPDDEDELKRVYEENKNTEDPLGNIIAALTKKRSKNKVTDKLLAMGLVTDRKQLYKKRHRKSGGDRREKRGGSAGDSDEGDGSGVDGDGPLGDDDLPSGGEILSSPSASDGSSADSDSSGDDDDERDLDLDAQSKHWDVSSEGNSETAAPDSLAHVVKTIVEKGYKDQLVWIHRRVTQTANSREGQEKIFPAPIVPLTEENETAMEDPLFMDFLQNVGFTPPSSEQEAFWRIPADLSASDLLNIARGIELDEDGQPCHQDVLASIQRVRPPSSSRKVKSKQKKDRQTKKLRKQQKRKQKEERIRKERKEKERKWTEEKKKSGEKEKKNRSRKSKGDESGNDSDDIVEDDVIDRPQDLIDGDNREKIDNSVSSDEGSEHRKGSKMPSAAQRRDALNAMLERRKGKGRHPSNSQPGTAGEGDSAEHLMETSTEERLTGRGPVYTLQQSGSLSRRDQLSKKRVKRLAESDSDSDGGCGRLMIDSDAASTSASPTKPAKRIRLLDSDMEDSDEKEKINTSSTVPHNSDKVSHSQSLSQDLLDFSDSDDDGGGTDDKDERSSNAHDDNAEDKKNYDSEDKDDDLALSNIKKKADAAPESFPATLYSQGPPASDDSDIDDHISLAAASKRKRIILSDDEDE